jgi:DNA polymerase-1
LNEILANLSCCRLNHSLDGAQVRKAFTADVGNHLVVADYGQLELRLLAHMTNCKSMLDAFKLGGDFHSRTALGMYDHIKTAIDKGVHCIPHYTASSSLPPRPPTWGSGAGRPPQ